MSGLSALIRKWKSQGALPASQMLLGIFNSHQSDLPIRVSLFSPSQPVMLCPIFCSVLFYPAILCGGRDGEILLYICLMSVSLSRVWVELGVGS